MLEPTIECVTPEIGPIMLNCFPCNPDCKPEDYDI